MNIFFDVKSADKACNTNVINFCLLAEDDRVFYAELNDIENFCDNNMLFNSKHEMDLYDIISCSPDDFFYKDVKSYIQNYILDKYIQRLDSKNFSEILLPILKSISILSIDDIFCEDNNADTER